MDLVASQGFVYTILSKLDVKGGQWKLAAIINDGTGALEIDFCPQVRSQYFNDESIRLFGNSFLFLTLFVFSSGSICLSLGRHPLLLKKSDSPPSCIFDVVVAVAMPPTLSLSLTLSFEKKKH